MKIFVTSDTHFGHSNIIKYCQRPFVTANEMDEAIIANWNAVVGKSDLVWHLGDFAMGNPNAIKKYLHRLNGTINLVMGNHDRYTQRQYLNMGFHKVYDKPVLIDDFVLLSHRPIEFITDNMPFANIYGHIHQQERFKTMTSNTVCACVERWDYRPIPMETIFDYWKNINQQ